MFRSIALLSVLFIVACSEPASVAPVASPSSAEASASAQSQSEQSLYSWLDEVFNAELEYSPTFKTSMGMIDDLEAYAQWGDWSDAASVAANERTQRYLALMRESFNVNDLSAEERISYRFAEYQWELGDRLHQFRKSGYVFSPLLDSVSSLMAFLINNHRVQELAHAEAYLSRLQNIDAVIDTMVAEAAERAEAGVRPPSFAYPRLISAAHSQLQGAEFGAGEAPGALLADFTAKVHALELPEPQANELIGAAETALSEGYKPAIERYIAFLQEQALLADDRDGVWKLPNGEQYYASQLELFTTRNDLSAAEVHAIGLAEVERIQGEMRQIMQQVNFDGSLQAFFEFLRTDPQFYLPNTAEGRQQYLDESTRMIDQVMVVAPQFFDTLPAAGLEVRAVEPFREATATGAFYNQPAMDGSRPGYYYVNLAKMEDNSTYLMESLAYHEGAPGHHFQIALAQELDALPMLQRVTFYSAYVEGWALYAEQLGKDMGFFEDPYMDFGRLSYEIFRAVRLVVDTGIHDQRWTRQQAIDYMMANTPMTEGDITPEVERYITWPGQAVSYKIGMMTILELRELARTQLGDAFTYGGFHDAVLTAGSLPLPILTERVMAWIESVKSQ